VKFDKRDGEGVAAKGWVYFYQRRDDDSIWSRAMYTLAGKDWSSNEHVVGIPDGEEQEISILETKEFDYNANPLLYTGTIDTDTLDLSVDVILIEGWTLLGHGEGNMEQGVTVQFNEEGRAQGEVRFYLMNGLELWATWKYILDGETDFQTEEVFNENVEVLDVSQWVQQASPIHPMDPSSSFDVTIGPLQYTGTVDLITLAFSVDAYLESSQTLLGHADGNLKDGVKLQLKTIHESTGVDKTIGFVQFYVEWDREIWANSKLLLDGQRYNEDVKLFVMPLFVQTQPHTIDSSKSFDVKAWPLQYTGTLDTNTLRVSVDVYLETCYKSKTLLGHADRNLDDEVEFAFSKAGIAEGRVLFYVRNGGTWGAMFAESTVILDGGVYRNDVPVLNIPWPAQVQVQQSHNKQHPISTLDRTSFDAIVGPLQYTGIFDTKTQILSIDVDVLDVTFTGENIHLGSEKSPLRHSGGVLVEFNKEGVAAGKVLFYEKDWKVWAMARFTLYGQPYRSNVAVWEIPE
jgi:hypothetical protein